MTAMPKIDPLHCYIYDHFFLYTQEMVAILSISTQREGFYCISRTSKYVLSMLYVHALYNILVNKV